MKKKDPTICYINGCNNPGYLVYYGKFICAKHFDQHCSENAFNLKKVLRIEERPIKSSITTLKDIG